MRNFPPFCPQVCDEEDEEGLNNEWHGNQTDVQRIAQYDFSLKGKYDDERTE